MVFERTDVTMAQRIEVPISVGELVDKVTILRSNSTISPMPASARTSAASSTRWPAC
jgi:hypothetical protein